MKLYGKITSERASKGQGGKHLNIELSGEDKKTICEMSVDIDKHNQVYITLDGYTPDVVFFNQFPCENCLENTEQKDKKQKSDNICETCGKDNGKLTKKLKCYECENIVA